MSDHATARVLLGGALLACAGGGAERTPESNTPATAETQMTQDATTIDGAALSRALEAGGIVAIVRIAENEIWQPGTRGERFVARAVVLARVLGEAADTLAIQRYTSDEDLVLLPERIYAVALEAAPAGSGQLTLIGHVEVAEDDVDASAARHRAALENPDG